MAITIKDFRSWLEEAKDDWIIGIDEGGLGLIMTAEDADWEFYLEIGGMPDVDKG